MKLAHKKRYDKRKLFSYVRCVIGFIVFYTHWIICGHVDILNLCQNLNSNANYSHYFKIQIQNTFLIKAQVEYVLVRKNESLIRC